MRRKQSIAWLLVGLLVPALGAAEPSITRDEFKMYMETNLALKDPRVLQMPEARRLPEIARVNFKMKAGALQEVLDKVEAAGGAEGLATKGNAAVKKALEAQGFGDRLQEVRVDTGSAHVVTYIKWTAGETDVVEEAVRLALHTSNAAPITSTVHLWAVDEDGEDYWRAKIGADRTRHVREDRIPDWARTRYLRLFEVDLEAPKKSKTGMPSEPQVGP